MIGRFWLLSARRNRGDASGCQKRMLALEGVRQRAEARAQKKGSGASIAVISVEEVRMNDKVGIWIDHRKAVIVFASTDRVTVTTLESQVGPHSRYSGRAGSPAPEGGEDEGGEKKYEK